MGHRIDQSETAHDVQVERFARRTVRLGFVGGQEKTIQFDSKTDTTECETQYRQYVEAERDEPHPEGRLADLARKRNVFTVADRNDVSYREFVGMDEKYLVSWDDGATIRIVDPEELDHIMDMASSMRAGMESESRSQTSIPLEGEEPEPAYDTDIPEDEVSESEEESEPEVEEEDEGAEEEPQSEAEPEPEPEPESEPEVEEEGEEVYDTDIPEPVN